MTHSDWLTLMAMAVTIVSMAISIRQARSALKSSQAAKKAMTAVQLAAVAERLRSAQEHIRDVSPDKASKRGFKFNSRFDIIRREFDSALSALPKAGMGGRARTHLADAQNQLNIYHRSLPDNPNSDTWQKLQIFVQDSVSELTSTTLDLGEKNDQ